MSRDDGIYGIPGLDPIQRRPGYPPRTGYSQRGLLTVGNPGAPVSLDALFGEADQFTVQVDVDTSPVTAVDGVVKTIVNASLRVAGNSISRTYDVVGGLSFSGNAEGITVEVADQSPTATGTQYNVTITVSRFPRAGTGLPPTRIGFFGAIPNASAQLVNVPKGAKSFAVYGAGSAGLTVEQRAKDGTTVLFTSDVVIGEFMPLVAGAAIIKVNNPSANPANATVVFGIDG